MKPKNRKNMETTKTTKKNLLKSFRKDQSGKFHILLILLILLVAVIFLIIKFGLGKGSGEAGQDGKGDPKTENRVEATNSITPAQTPSTAPSNTPSAAPALKQFSVVIEKTEMIFDNETFDNAQSLIDAMQKEAGEGAGFSVILHEENAVANTLEDLTNALDKNGISWATPTPAPKE